MKKYLFLIIPLILFLLGVWDLDGLRQGTETFYLKISREMGDQFSILTPLHRGTPHWSKPPFVFWISLPFYWLLPFDHHTSARISMIVLTFLTTYLISKEVDRNIKESKIFIFTVLITTFGFFRYGKIYMMDIPLATLSTLSILYFYNSQRYQLKKLLIYSILTLAMSILVKGPVSLVMIGMALAAYGVLHPENRKLSMLKNGAIYLIAGTALASIWFFLCYLKYGQHFIDYFFLRENLGKFESQSYPMRKLFQGLLLYGLPWTILLIPRIKNIKSLNSDYFKTLRENAFASFCFVSFLSFFFIWFIPTQRSHHYAIPALPFFLIFLIPQLKQVNSKSLLKINIVLFGLIGTIGLALSLRFISSFSYTPLIISLFLIGTIPISIKFKENIQRQAILFLAGFSICWSLLIPQFSLPKIPQAQAQKIKTQSVYTVFKKNYYFEQVLGHKINSLHAHEVSTHSKNSQGYYILTEQFYGDLKDKKQLTKIGQWPVWKRRVKWPQIKEALINNDLTNLQENYLLLRSTSID